MKTLFIEARRSLKQEDREKIKKAVREFIQKFPKVKKICLVASIQYLDFMHEFRKTLEKHGKKVLISKGRLAKYSGQILGCDIMAGKKLEGKADAFLLLGSGSFHALQLATQTAKPVFLWQEKGIFQLSKEETEKLKNKRKAAITKFLASPQVGIITSTKPGQGNLELAIKLKKILEKHGKQAFIFIADTINIYELENFSCNAWINTACPALILDSTKLVNWKEVEKFFV